VPSNIPALKSRSIQPDAIAAAGLNKPYPLGELRKLLPRVPTASAAPAKVTNGSASLPFKSAISKCEFNRKNVLVVSGWALSTKPVNRIEIWLENQFMGIANLRMHRNDIALKFPEYHEADSGYQFFGETIRPDGARVSTRIRMYSDDSLLHEEIVVPKDN